MPKYETGEFKAAEGHGYLAHDKCCTIYYEPTANCQIYSIAGINEVIDNFLDSQGKVNVEDITEYFKKVQKTGGKNQLLIDVSDRYSPYIEQIFEKDEITFKVPYRNTTGADLTMFLIKTYRLQGLEIPDEEDDDDDDDDF